MEFTELVVSSGNRDGEVKRLLTVIVMMITQIIIVTVIMMFDVREHLTDLSPFQRGIY